MSLSDWLIHADTQWIGIETDPLLLTIEIERTEALIALYAGDLNAGDLDACDGDLEFCRQGLAMQKEVLKRLFRQAARLIRANVATSSSPPISLSDVRERMDRANALDTFEVLDRITGVWARLGPKDEYWLCCPLPGHDDHTPSFHMNDDGRWYCFGCHRGGGDVVSFAATYLGKSQMSGLILLEDLFGL